MQQQQAGPMFPAMPSLPLNTITTEQIQRYLDENKKLIVAILENQNLGKLAECAQYQAQLQKNLMYLAAIADAQPQTPSAPPPPQPIIQQQQMAHHPSLQQGSFYMMQQQQHHLPPPMAMAQQPSVAFPPRPQAIQERLTGQSQPHVLVPARPTAANDSMNRGLMHGAGNYINGSKKQEAHDGGQGSSAVAGDKEEAAK